MAKRILAIILAAVMVFAFAACANTDAPADAEGGCGGAVSLAGIALVAALGTCTTFVIKKKED